jgi:hypothetical protein
MKWQKTLELACQRTCFRWVISVVSPPGESGLVIDVYRLLHMTLVLFSIMTQAAQMSRENNSFMKKLWNQKEASHLGLTSFYERPAPLCGIFDRLAWVSRPRRGWLLQRNWPDGAQTSVCLVLRTKVRVPKPGRMIDSYYGNAIGVSVTVGCGTGVGENGMKPLK